MLVVLLENIVVTNPLYYDENKLSDFYNSCKVLKQHTRLASDNYPEQRDNPMFYQYFIMLWVLIQSIALIHCASVPNTEYHDNPLC